VTWTSNQKGAIAEAAVTLHATQLGIVVLKPLADGCRYDLVLDTGDRLYRTQCKWAARDGDVVVVRGRTCRHTPNGYVRTSYSAGEVDGIAAWCPDTGESYFVPIADVAGRSVFCLRLRPARNNQELLVHWAADYRLGAIAQLGERRHGMAEAEGSSPSSSTSEGPLR
jgi:hypothetical protein